MNTVVVNAFGGPGAGKTTAAWELAAGLKKIGLVTEYVPEYAKELVWDENYDALDGTLHNQRKLYEEQKRRIDRLIGKVDVVITDSPILLNLMYCKEPSIEYDSEVLAEFNEYNNFNFFVQRGSSFEQQGRIHDLEKSKEIDREIKNFLNNNNVYYGIYTHERLSYLVDNIRRFHRKLEKNTGKEEQVDVSNKIDITISSRFVEKGLMRKMQDGTYKEYNRVTLPNNTIVDGKDLGGYQFFPLYANPSVYNANAIQIPFLKDMTLELKKGEDKVQVDPQKLATAIEDNYHKWKMQHTQLGNILGEEVEVEEIADFGWRGKSFTEVIKERLSNSIDLIVGKESSADMVKANIMANDMLNNKLISDKFEASEFIREFYYEAVDMATRSAEERMYFDKDIDAFADPVGFVTGMIRQAEMDILEEGKVLDEMTKKNKDIVFSAELIGKIKGSLGLSAGQQQIPCIRKNDELAIEI